MNDNFVTEHLIKIKEQNDRIIDLLENIVDSIGKITGEIIPDDSQKDEFHKICAEKINRLTPREHQIIELVLEGKLNKEIAYAFSISLSTVESHRSNIMRKMEANNVAQLIKTYLQCQEAL